MDRVFTFDYVYSVNEAISEQALITDRNYDL